MRDQLARLILDLVEQFEKQGIALFLVAAGTTLNFHPAVAVKSAGNMILGAGLHRLTQ
jgi:hypothetical protein